MARNNHNDWTDELRDMIDGVELSPSEGGWERLKADLRPRKAVWWPYAVPAAACLLLGGVFLFRERPSDSVLDVVSPAPSAMVADVVAPAAGVSEDVCFADPTLKGPPSYDAEVARGEQQASLCLRPEQQSFSSPEGTVSGTPAARSNTNSLSMSSSATDNDVPAPFMGNLCKEDFVSTILEPESDEVMQEAVPSFDEYAARPVVPDEPVQPTISVAETEFGTTAETEPVATGWDDFGDEPIVRQRRQHRKITVTVSAGGAFGSAGNGIYFAQAAPVTKAGGEVLDITEVIQHSTPKQTALGLSIPITDKMDIGTGIDHMELNSVVGSGSQNLEWLGVPLRLGYRLAEWGPSSISLGAGFKGEKCLSATLLGMDYTEPFQWAANMGADCCVRIFGPVSFSLTPELSYYFTDTVLPTYRTDHPLTFTLRAGLSLNL